MNPQILGKLGVRLWAASLVCLVGLTVWLLMPSYRAVFSQTVGALTGTGEGLPDAPTADGVRSRSSQLASSSDAASGGAVLSGAGQGLATDRGPRAAIAADAGDAIGLGSSSAALNPSASGRTSGNRAAALTGAASSSGNHGAGVGSGASGHASGAGGGAGGGASRSTSSAATAEGSGSDAPLESGVESAALPSTASEGAGGDSAASAASAGSPPTGSPSLVPAPKGGGRSGTGLLTLDDADSLDSFHGTPAGDAASMPDPYSSPVGSSISPPPGSSAGSPAPALDIIVTDLGGLAGGLPGTGAPPPGHDLVAPPVITALVVVPPGEGSAALPPDAQLDFGAPPAGDLAPPADQPGGVPEPSLSLLSALGIGASALARRYRCLRK